MRVSRNLSAWVMAGLLLAALAGLAEGGGGRGAGSLGTRQPLGQGDRWEGHGAGRSGADPGTALPGPE